MGWPLIPYLEPCSSGPWGGRSVGCWLGPRGPLTGVRVDQEGAGGLPSSPQIHLHFSFLTKGSQAPRQGSSSHPPLLPTSRFGGV